LLLVSFFSCFVVLCRLLEHGERSYPSIDLERLSFFLDNHEETFVREYQVVVGWMGGWWVVAVAAVVVVVVGGAAMRAALGW
jgi:hypothetical protein